MACLWRSDMRLTGRYRYRYVLVDARLKMVEGFNVRVSLID